MARKFSCVIGRHRWTWNEGDTLRCFSCGKSRPVGKTLLCRVGAHRWVAIQKDGGEPYRECRFCKKYGGSPKFAGGGGIS